MPIHLPGNHSVGAVGELRRKRLGKEIGLEPIIEHTMRQVDSSSGLEPEDREELRDEPD